MVSRERQLPSCVYNASCHTDENRSVALEGKKVDMRYERPPLVNA